MNAHSKAGLRRAALEGRAGVPDEIRRAFAIRAARDGLALARHHGSRSAAAYFPVRGEADPLPLLAELAAAGIETSLPRLAGRGKPLRFHLWRPGDALVDTPLGLREPSAGSPLLEPDLLIVPLAALTAKKQLAIGLAFAAQEVASIPAEPHDQPLAFVITERETIDCRTSRKHASSLHW